MNFTGVLVTEAVQAESSNTHSETEHTEHQEIGDCTAFYKQHCIKEMIQCSGLSW